MQESFLNGIEYKFMGFDTPMEKAYQINNGLDDTLQNKGCIQWAASNWRRAVTLDCHRYDTYAMNI